MGEEVDSPYSSKLVPGPWTRQPYVVGDFVSFWESVCRVELGPIDGSDWFRIGQRGSTWGKEILGGFTIFFTVAYILIINPVILNGTGIPTHAVFFSTALASGLLTILIGLVTNLPIFLGPSLALNILFRQVAQPCAENPNGDILGLQCENWGKQALPWSDALGAVFLSGWLYSFFTLCGLRGYFYEIIPRSLRAAITVGTGFFITNVGLKIGQINRVTVRARFVPDVSAASHCNVLTGYCPDPVDLDQQWYNQGIAFFKDTPAANIAVLGIVFVVVLELAKVPGSVIISIWLATFIGINYYRCDSADENANEITTNDVCVTNLNVWAGHPRKIPFIVDVHNIPAGKLTFKYAKKPFFWQVVFSFLFFEFFDSFGAITNIVTRMGDTKDHPTVATDRVNRAMFIDSFSVWLGAIIGANSITPYIESTVGVEVGARTGVAAIVVGSLFLLCLLFVYPFIAIIPPCATTCALVMIGVYSIQEYKNIDTSDYIHLFSGFATIAVMGFTYSITNGICIGVILYTWLQLVAYLVGKFVSLFPSLSWVKVREGVSVELPHPVLLIVASFMAARFQLLKQQ